MVPLARLVELYETGFTLRQVSDLTGVPRITVRGRLIACGVQMRDRSESARIRFARRPMVRS